MTTAADTRAYFYVTGDGDLGVAHYWEELRFVDDLATRDRRR